MANFSIIIIVTDTKMNRQNKDFGAHLWKGSGQVHGDKSEKVNLRANQ